MQNGDQNTKFFHRFASARKRKNDFHRIKNQAGEWQETGEGIQGVVTSYFVELFKSTFSISKLTDREVVNQVTDEEKRELTREITTMEVKSVIFSMHPEKATGRDGLNPTFFQTYWGIVG